MPCVTHITLDMLDRDETVQLACAKLKVRDLPLFIQNLLYQKAKGLLMLDEKSSTTLAQNAANLAQNTTNLVTKLFN